jgi:hypothetical protein
LVKGAGGGRDEKGQTKHDQDETKNDEKRQEEKEAMMTKKTRFCDLGLRGEKQFSLRFEVLTVVKMSVAGLLGYDAA